MPKLAKKGKRKRRGKTVKGKSSKLPAKFSKLPVNSDNEVDSDIEEEDEEYDLAKISKLVQQNLPTMETRNFH